MIVKNDCYRVASNFIRQRIKKILVAEVDVIYCTILLYICTPWYSEHKFKKRFIKT